MLLGKRSPQTLSLEMASQHSRSGLGCSLPPTQGSLRASFRTRTVMAQQGCWSQVSHSQMRPAGSLPPARSPTQPGRLLPSLHLLLPSASCRAPRRERKPGDRPSWPSHKMETLLLPGSPRGSPASMQPDRSWGESSGSYSVVGGRVLHPSSSSCRASSQEPAGLCLPTRKQGHPPCPPL